MIDFALDAQRHENLAPLEAITKACLIRFRPIMMTTMCALFGTLPIALGLGATMAFLSRVLRKHIGLTGRTALALAALSVVAQMAYLPGWLSPSACSMTENLLLLPAQIWIFTVLIYRATRRHKVAQLLIAPTLLDVGFSMADNLSLLLAQAGLTRVPYFLEVKLPLPPFTMQPGILLHLVFLLAMLLFLIQRFSHASQREQRLAGEMEAARQVQLMLLPNAIHDCPGFTMDCVYQPAEQVGGDFFQLIALPGDELLVVVGDVSGKGLPAALMVSALVGAIRSEAAHAANPAGLLTALNHHILGHSHSGFTTALAARISATGHMTVANAGHLAPYRNGVEMEIPGSLPLGLVPDFTPESGTFQLAPGDRLTFLSDGVIEARDRQGKLLGFERARELTRLSAAQIVQAAQSFGQEDDITVLTLDLV